MLPITEDVTAIMRYWDDVRWIKPEPSGTAELHSRRAPAPFGEKLAERLIKLLPYRRDLVIAPYNGSGTTAAVAKRGSDAASSASTARPDTARLS